MKIKSAFLLIPALLIIACSSSDSAATGFELKGKFTNAHNETVYLEQLSPEGVKPIDTMQLDAKGEFTITPSMTETGFYRIKFSEKNFATFIFDVNQKVVVKGDAQNLGNTYTVEGSPDSKLFWDLNKASADNYRKRDSLQQAFQVYVNSGKMDSLKLDSVSKVMEKPYLALVAKQNAYLKDFIEKNTTSFASLAAIQQLQPEEFLSTFIKLDDGLFKKFPNSAYIKSFHESVASQKKLAIGTPAPELTMNNTEDKTISLSSLKGKVVLVDFWASWCGPCRAENPNVVKAYTKYHSKGFEVFSVSLDKDKDKWIAAIQKDGLVWPYHVCDFKNWQSPVVQMYNFNGIPYNVLLDKDGNILAKSLRGEDLEKKLAEIFK